ncbi:MAG: hypothetical protein JNN05_08625 [Candidatus Omnitrophica bacterium]|nr:hypothetical protein [Candidatus Omnitrophota bacterium]
MKKLISIFLFTLVTIFLTGELSAHAQSFKHVDSQYIVALGDPQAKSGTGAEKWGLWTQDPGPRGCRLDEYENLKSAGGMTPAQWQFDPSDWWLEEHGLLMEKPQFPLASGKYVVTGGREVTAILTITPADDKGEQRWELSGGAKLYDVTHLPCHAARYTPAQDDTSCSPEKAKSASYPVAPGVVMPEVEGCHKQDYAVLFVMGVEDK